MSINFNYEILINYIMQVYSKIYRCFILEGTTYLTQLNLPLCTETLRKPCDGYQCGLVFCEIWNLLWQVICYQLKEVVFISYLKYTAESLAKIMLIIVVETSNILYVRTLFFEDILTKTKNKCCEDLYWLYNQYERLVMHKQIKNA